MGGHTPKHRKKDEDDIQPRCHDMDEIFWRSTSQGALLPSIARITAEIKNHREL
jgi:hypothetical protein